MTLEQLDYPLPPELIAQHPFEPRDAARMLVVRRGDGSLYDDTVLNLPNYLSAGDLLIVNESYVLPARFWLYRQTGGRIEGLFVRLLDEPAGAWEVLLRWAGALRVGERLTFESAPHRRTGILPVPNPSGKTGILPVSASGTEKGVSPVPATAYTAELLARKGGGYYHFRVESSQPVLEVLSQVGVVPLPKYIEREAEAEDAAGYQTVFANAHQAGSVAAPTAGLHFTPRLLDKLREKGVGLAKVTLHVGPGTFKPISTPDLAEHQMHPEFYHLPPATAEAISAAKTQGNRVIAVGSTSLRTLESAEGQAGSGWTRLFIYPPYSPKVTDAMLTNFHLPHSTLLALVMAIGGEDLIRKAYAHAVRERYRFFSYGDAMLIV